MDVRVRINIIFTKHGDGRLIDREITRTQVRFVIHNPTKVIPGNGNNKFECFGSPIDPPYDDSPFFCSLRKNRDEH